MLLAWIVFPLVLALLSLGCGLLLERLAGGRLPGPLIPPAGFALLVVIGSFTTATSATATLTVPAVVAACVAGFGLSLPLRGRRLDCWGLAAACAVFAVYAAPVVLSGGATFAGYLTLDDTATWLAMTDRVMEHGRSLTGLEPSTYSTVLRDYLAVGAPVGANLPLGTGGKLVGVDIAWLFQPYLALLGAMLSLAIYGLVRPLVGSKALCAGIAFIGAQPALLYAYSLWSGMKELAAAAIIALLAALVPLLLAVDGNRLRRALPVATACAALISILTVGGVVWLAALLVPALVLGFWTLGARRVAPVAAIVAGLALVLSLPALLTASEFVRHVTAGDVLTSRDELGNLIRPLRFAQIFGIWPAGDFRTDPGDPGLAYALVVLVGAAAACGVVRAVIARAWGLVLVVAAAVVGALAIRHFGSPWVEAKALATASSALVVAALCGVAWALQRSRGVGFVAAAAAAAAIAGGVLWSNALAYRQAWLAPRAQLAELATIGHRFAGEGPTLMTEYQTYGTRHFLRNMDAEGAGDRRYRAIPLRNGQVVSTGGFADIDDFQLDAVLVYRTLVLLRSPNREPPAVELQRGLEREVVRGLAAGPGRPPHPRAPLARERHGPRRHAAVLGDPAGRADRGSFRSRRGGSAPAAGHDRPRPGRSPRHLGDARREPRVRLSARGRHPRGGRRRSLARAIRDLARRLVPPQGVDLRRRPSRRRGAAPDRSPGRVYAVRHGRAHDRSASAQPRGKRLGLPAGRGRRPVRDGPSRAEPKHRRPPGHLRDT